MKKEKLSSTVLSETEVPQPKREDVHSQWQRVVRRRSFLKGLSIASGTLPASALSTSQGKAATNTLNPGDIAILRFLAAAELIESDLWQQYNELGGVNGGNAAYKLALQNLDGDMPQYIADNTDDELSHAAFLNGYLKSKGADQVDLDKFRILPSSKATGARQIGRLTNLQRLNVDTSWYTRYRSKLNPDFGATFDQAVKITNQPAIPFLPDGKGGFISWPGAGRINAFDLNGNLVQRLVPSNGKLNVPWGLALAGPNFGVFSYALIVGNFGDGSIVAFDPVTGDFMGAMQDGKGNNLSIDGLWGLQFGTQGSTGNANGGDATTLYFAAAPSGGAHGLFGALRPAADSVNP
jgi:hypothetical protein